MGRMIRRCLRAATAALIAAPLAALAQPSMNLRSNGLQLSVRTLGYEQAASFYLARGVPAALVERYARSCVVNVALHSDSSAKTIATRLEDWRVEPEHGTAQKIRGRSDWLRELDQAATGTAARMAFEWAQLPETAELHPGDSIQGMLSVPINRNSAFTLYVRWDSGEKGNEARIQKIRCD